MPISISDLGRLHLSEGCQDRLLDRVIWSDVLSLRPAFQPGEASMPYVFRSNCAGWA
jgi:hypothetical protein